MNAATADGVELLVATVELIHNEEGFHRIYGDRIQGAERKYRIESERNQRRERLASTGWMFRSEAYDERGTEPYITQDNVPLGK